MYNYVLKAPKDKVFDLTKIHTSKLTLDEKVTIVLSCDKKTLTFKSKSIYTDDELDLLKCSILYYDLKIARNKISDSYYKYEVGAPPGKLFAYSNVIMAKALNEYEKNSAVITNNNKTLVFYSFTDYMTTLDYIIFDELLIELL